MDRKTIAVMIACIGFVVIWQGVLVPKYFMENKTVTAASTNAAPAIASHTSTSAGTNAASSFIAATNSTVRQEIAANAPEQLLVVTNENARYVFTSRGGGLKAVELVKFPETIARKRKDQAAVTNFATLNDHSHLPMLGILGSDALMGDGNFELSQSGGIVRAEKTLASGLRIVKEFTLSTNYLVNAKVRYENATGTTLALPQQDWAVGTATPMGGDDDGTAVGVMWYDGSKTHEALTAYFDNKTLGCFPGTPKPEYRDGASNVVWVATHNQFFACIVMPDAAAQNIVARAISMPYPVDGKFSDTNQPPRKGFETILIYPAVTIEAGKTVERNVNLFVGPKEYKTLASIASRFNNDADKAMGFGWAIFAFFAKGLLLLMNMLHNAFSISYGLAIVVITILLKVLFWPLTAASTKASQRMAALAPQINALKEKYKDDPAKFSQKQIEFFRENKINPVAGCLPMLVQLPVFFGFFTMLRTAIELRGASFLWATDLSKTDTIAYLAGFPINPLPLLYIATAIWQTHITPMSPTMDPVQQKMMKWMPLMFLVILYNFSSGLALYMTVNNLLTILQTKMTKNPYANGSTPAAPSAPATVSVLTPASKRKK
jgi:YidC/Oxa1 family membrane protein insertase